MDENHWKRANSESWQFSVSEFSDDVNLFYAGATRAKKLLSIPTTISNILMDFDTVHGWDLRNGEKEVAPSFMKMQQASEGDSLQQYKSFNLKGGKAAKAWRATARGRLPMPMSHPTLLHQWLQIPQEANTNPR